MKTYHSPGPWNLTKTAARLEVKPEGANFCYAFTRKDEANAKLIAAAPDMLEALQNAANVFAALATGQLDRIQKDSPALAQARAAIAKATA